MERAEVEKRIKQYGGKRVKVTRKDHPPVAGVLETMHEIGDNEYVWVRVVPDEAALASKRVHVPIGDIAAIEEVS